VVAEVGEVRDTGVVISGSEVWLADLPLAGVLTGEQEARKINKKMTRKPPKGFITKGYWLDELWVFLCG
jgi:hypothetical protein